MSRAYGLLLNHSLLHSELRVFVEMTAIEDLTFLKMSLDEMGIFWFPQNEFSVVTPLISLMRGSSKVEMEARRVSLALVLRSDSTGISITSGWYSAEFVKDRGRLSHFLNLPES